MLPPETEAPSGLDPPLDLEAVNELPDFALLPDLEVNELPDFELLPDLEPLTL
jgi:hypothetical protein